MISMIKIIKKLSQILAKSFSYNINFVWQLFQISYQDQYSFLQKYYNKFAQRISLLLHLIIV